MFRGMHTNHYAWFFSNLVSGILLLILIMIWYKAERLFPIEGKPFYTKNQVQAYLSRVWENKYSAIKPIYIPTGIYVKALKLKSPNDIIVAGYIWQSFPKKLHINSNRAFFLSEQLEFNQQKIMFHHDFKDVEIIGTYFEAQLRQKFNYRKYPFDNKIIKIEMWSPEYYKNIIFVPDFSSYEANVLGIHPGVSPKIELRDFIIKDSYFSYTLSYYKTNFGESNNISQYGFPGLYFAIILKRALFSAIVLHVLPLLVVFVFLFAILMMSSEKKKMFHRFKFTGTMVISNCAAMFFALGLIHAGLRTRLYSNQIIYLEYFYFLAYFFLIIVVLNNYILLKDSKNKIRFLHYKDNLIPKILFWPIILIVTLIISCRILFTN